MRFGEFQNGDEGFAVDVVFPGFVGEKRKKPENVSRGQFFREIGHFIHGILQFPFFNYEDRIIFSVSLLRAN